MRGIASRGREYTPVPRCRCGPSREGLPSSFGLTSSVWRSLATVGYESAFWQALHPLFGAVGALTHADAASRVSPDDGRAGGCAIWATGKTRTYDRDV